MRSARVKAALAGVVLAGAMIGVEAAPASAHIVSACAASTDWIVVTSGHPDYVAISSTQCKHRSTLTCQTAGGSKWTFTDPPASPSPAWNVNVCHSSYPYFYRVEFHAY